MVIAHAPAPAMRLNQIRDLLAVVEAGSLRAAARRIGVSQPAMSKSLAQLEREVQAQLLLRTARGIVLTPAGRALVARGRVIQGELAKAQDDIAALRGSREGTVAFGTAPATSVILIPNAMARFRTHWPRSRVRIREGMRTALMPLVRDETLDFAVAENVANSGEAGVQFRPLIVPELVVAARRGHPLGDARSLRELEGAAWLVFNPLGANGALERSFAAAGLGPPDALVHCESYAAALALIARGDLLGLVMRPVIEEPLAARFLQRVPIREAIERPTIGIFSRADVPLSPTAAAMVQALGSAARSLARRL
jgi:LysR family transcriptional regulator of abg operon